MFCGLGPRIYSYNYHLL